MKKSQIQAPCTVILAGINIAVFLILSFMGMTEDSYFMLQHGAMYVPYVTDQGEYYRLFTSMFLHFGFEHLANNMMILLVMGWILEPELGSVKTGILYLISGIGGNVLSAFMEVRAGDYAVGAGASGAIFGIIGALLFIALREKGRVGNITGRRILFMIVLSLYFGYTSTGVDNAAHIGGLITGFFLAVLLYRKKNMVRDHITE